MHVWRPTANKCKIRKKTSIFVLKIIQGHCFRCQSKPVYDFLLVIIATFALSRTVSEIWRLLGWNPYARGRYSRSRSSKVIDLGVNGKPIGDFLLVINCNRGPISHRFRDMATFRLKSLPRGRYSRSRSSKVIDLGLNGKPIDDFLLVINCNIGPISHRFRDMASYWLKRAKFSYPPLI